MEESSVVGIIRGFVGEERLFRFGKKGWRLEGIGNRIEIMILNISGRVLFKY